MDSLLKYTDETDKSLGIAGMAISLIACDSEDYLASVSLEEGEEAIAMASEFFFNGNPSVSAKIAWNEMLKQYQITTAMLIGNIMCRALVAGHSPKNKILDLVHDIVKREGAAQCSLEDDEIENVYRKNFSYYNRLFKHPAVQDIARDFATTLRMARRMTAGEVVENLHRLNSL